MEILGVDRDGCFAEFIAVPERVCWINDPEIPPEYASVQEPLGNAVYTVLGEDNDVAGKSVAVVGDGMAGTPGVAARFFGTLGRAGINIRAIAQGSSERNISAVVDSANATRALRAAHSGFYLSHKTISIGLIGEMIIFTHSRETRDYSILEVLEE